jgi:hypothetical protein
MERLVRMKWVDSVANAHLVGLVTAVNLTLALARINLAKMMPIVLTYSRTTSVCKYHI